MIKNIVFDVGNVLVDFVPDQAMERIGILKDTIPALMEATVYSPHWIELDRGVMEEADVINLMIADHPELSQEIHTFFDKAKEMLVVPRYYVPDWMQDLKKRGYQIYILSNYPAYYFKLHEEKVFTFMQYVDGKIVSGDVRMIKPDAEIYQKLLETYQLDPQECLFMDDRQENVDGASREGIHTVLFTTYEETRKKVEQMMEEIR